MLYVGWDWMGWDGWLSKVIGLLRAPSVLISDTPADNPCSVAAPAEKHFLPTF